MKLLVLSFVVVFGFGAVFSQRGYGARDCITRPGQYDPCSASCGGGLKTREIKILQHPTGYGRRCPSILSETVTCNTQPCGVDCIVEPGEYGPCSATCGVGIQTKVDHIVQQSSNGGRSCPPLSQLSSVRPCIGLQACPLAIDCEIGYRPYSQCSAPCGGGIQTRTAFIVNNAANGGTPCPIDIASLTDSKPCNIDVPCSDPKNCEFTSGDYGECSVKCGSGIQSRRVYIVSPPENGGQACPTELVQSKPCFAGPCPPPQDCLMSYPPFSPCSVSCGGGTQTTTGQVTRQPSPGGSLCPDYSQRTVQRSCASTPCIQVLPRDCVVEFGPYSVCSAECGGGYRTRKGYVKHEAEFGGLQCPSPSQLKERIPCNQEPCREPKDCIVEPTQYGECSRYCGGGTQTRSLSIIQHSEFGGRPCPQVLTETRACNTHYCSSNAGGQPVETTTNIRQSFTNPTRIVRGDLIPVSLVPFQSSSQHLFQTSNQNQFQSSRSGLDWS